MENEIKLPETKKMFAFEAERLEQLMRFIDGMPHLQAKLLLELLGQLTPVDVTITKPEA
jgi:hypothetical protein